jgi:hypothetical protein
MFTSVPTETFFKRTVTVVSPGQVRIVEPVRPAKAFVRDQLEVLAAEGMAHPVELNSVRHHLLLDGTTVPFILAAGGER